MHGFNQASQSLNFGAVLSIVSKNARCALGKQSILSAEPFISHSDLERYFTKLSELDTLLISGRLPLGPFEDIRPLLNQAEPIGSFLEARECLQFITFLEISEATRSYLTHLDSSFSNLRKEGHGLADLNPLLNQLQFTIDPDGNIYDNASPELKVIRKDISRLQQDVHTVLDRLSRKHKEHLQETYTTLRDGRLVLPVREFSVSKIPGIVHGQSGSGATKYVEPMAIVGINNDLQGLFVSERREIIKILQRLTSLLKENRDELNANLKTLVFLDALQARALYGRSHSASIPVINNDFSWDIRDARHPLLLEKIGKETVPLNLSLSEKQHVLIISGPNAGGKTVALKTVGVLQLMLQCGIPLPVDARSSFPYCEQIFVLIGDKQSLENDLSTFSSHVKGLQTILDESRTNGLVLIDEIGIGTEPSGGAALAIAVLEQLNRPGLCTIVSTHQTQLKVYAAENEGVLNAAMQYDIQNLKPLFILETGIPGSSFTFDICRRYGISESVLKRAREIEGSKQHNIEILLNEIAQKSAGFQQRLDEISIQESKLNALTHLYDQRMAESRQNQKQIERDARQKAREIVATANSRIEAAIREIKESAAEKNTVKKARKKLEDFKTQNEESLEPEIIKTSIPISKISKGQRARSISFNVSGTIAKVNIPRKEIVLEREGMRMTVPLSDLELISKKGNPLDAQPEHLINTESVSADLPNRLDLRGLDTQDAISELEFYLDRIVHNNWEEVTIVHGKGTGALRKAVQLYLSKKKNIFSYRTGRYGEGDTGVTIVGILKNSEQ